MVNNFFLVSNQELKVISLNIHASICYFLMCGSNPWCLVRKFIGSEFSKNSSWACWATISKQYLNILLNKYYMPRTVRQALAEKNR